MTPDKQGYLPCPTCGVLEPVGRPHPATFCARIKQASPRAVMTDIDDIDDGLSTGPEPVTVDVEALWGGM